MTDQPSSTDRRLDELGFLHEIAQLATLARDWDELMHSIVDGTTAAMGVEVCSFYLADHERMRLTLAATNGLDRAQVGRVSLAWGEGITGRVAATRTPIAVEDVTVDERFAWVRGFDIEALTGMLSVPLEWHDTVVGVLNVQTRERRLFGEGEIAFLRTIAALLAGIVEKGRLTAEVEARLAELTALDAARSELLSVVTHELRTPLSVVRVYVDLLAEAAEVEEATLAAPEWHDAASDQLGRLDRLVDSILASVRGEGLTGLSRAPFDAVRAVDDTVETLRLLLRSHPIRWDRPSEPMIAIGDATRFRQVLEQLLENESKYAPTADGVSIGVWLIGEEIQVYVTDDGPGVPREDWESVFEPFVRIEG
ncbi:MAG: GAF domain-containing protein, partial [Chloroflexota bacterium]